MKTVIFTPIRVRVRLYWGKKRYHFQMGLQRIKFSVPIEQRQRINKKCAFAFVQCK